MKLAKVFNIDQNIIQIYNNKNIKLLDKDLINVALKNGQNIKMFKKHNLILKMAVLYPEIYLPFIAFTDSYPMIYIYQIQLSKPLGLA